MELSTFPSSKLTDFFDCASAEAPLESEVVVQPAVFSIIDAEMRSSSSIARPKTPSTDFSKFELSTVPARLSINEPGALSPILREFFPF